jgi:hypothetical protein
MTELELARRIWNAIIVCHVASFTDRIKFKDIVKHSTLLRPDITDDIVRGHVADFVQAGLVECVGVDTYKLAIQRAVDGHPAGGGAA